MTSKRTDVGSGKVFVAALATLLWVGTSIAVVAGVETSPGLTGVNVGVSFLALLFAYYVFFHEESRRWATIVASLLVVTGVVGLVAAYIREPTLTLASNVLALVGMFALVVFLWR